MCYPLKGRKGVHTDFFRPLKASVRDFCLFCASKRTADSQAYLCTLQIAPEGSSTELFGPYLVYYETRSPYPNLVWLKSSRLFNPLSDTDHSVIYFQHEEPLSLASDPNSKFLSTVSGSDENNHNQNYAIIWVGLVQIQLFYAWLTGQVGRD